MEKITSVCEVCGVSFSYYEAKHGIRKYCSQICYNKQRNGKPPVKKICQFCGAEFLTKHAHRNRSKYCSRECAGKAKRGLRASPATEFQKGQTATNELPFLSITKRIQKKDKPRYWIKNLDGQWTLLATFIWESVYGKIKEDDIVHHINGNTLDDQIKNLIALPRSDHPKYHGRWGLKDIEAEQLNYYRNRYEDQ